MTTIQPIGASHAAYYIGSAQRQAGAVGYYAGRSGVLSGKWVAAGDMNVIAGAPISAGELTAMLAGCDPRTGERLGRKYDAGGTFVDRLGVTRKRRSRAAFDVTYSVPKSVSATWALAEPEVRKQIEFAFDLSADAAVAYLQRHAVASRSGTDGVNSVAVPAGRRWPVTIIGVRGRATRRCTPICSSLTEFYVRTANGATPMCIGVSAGQSVFLVPMGVCGVRRYTPVPHNAFL